MVVTIAAWRPALAQEPPPPQPRADSITPALVALGDSVFHGRIGRATCFACHGAKGVGGLAPPLTSADIIWLEGGMDDRTDSTTKPLQGPAPIYAVGAGRAAIRSHLLVAPERDVLRHMTQFTRETELCAAHHQPQAGDRRSPASGARRRRRRRSTRDPVNPIRAGGFTLNDNLSVLQWLPSVGAGCC
ncbi:MAG: c-type cytochrome [Gammaproteobacteria bacterium]